MHLRPVELADVPMLVRHRVRHSKENGKDGDPIFRPFETDYVAQESDQRQFTELLQKPVTEPGWLRSWIVTDEEEVYGELALVNQPALATALHRCLLMMGLERSIRRQGWGSKLISEAISWARERPSLDWISLNVFENNLPAKALYTKFGFRAVGTTRDLFRVYGKSIDDTHMVLRLR